MLGLGNFLKKMLGLGNFRLAARSRLLAILRQPSQDCVVVLGHPPNVRFCTLNHHFSVSSCCSELTFMFCYESLKLAQIEVCVEVARNCSQDPTNA